MGLFNKLFGGGNNDANGKPNIKKLLAADNTTNAIIELDNYICKLCEFGDSMDKLNASQKIFFYNQGLEKEINNGGFNQYFFNSAGNFAHETIESLKAIGAATTAAILQKAIAQFPDSTVPTDWTARQELLETIEDEANEIWEELDQQFYAYADNLTELNLRFIKQNQNDF